MAVFRPVLMSLSLGVFLTLFVPGQVFAGVPIKIAISKADSVTNTTDSKGKAVTCVTFKGKTYAGKLTKNGKFLKTTIRKVKKKLAKLKAAKRRAGSNKKLAKRLQKKIKAQKALKKRQLAACKLPDPEDIFAPLSRAVTNEDVRYLAEKAGFGFGPKEAGLASIKSQGINAVVTEFMRTKNEANDFQATYNDWLDGALDNDLATSFSGIRRAWTYAMQNGNNAYRERFALWLFALWTAAEDVLDANEADLLNDYINGNSNIPLAGIRGYAHDPDMRDMAINMSRSAMMLIYLDGASNIKSNPNENFARELFELFTTSPEDLNGNPNYTEQGDIVKAAAALTGWRVAGGERGFSPFDQDTRTFILFEGTGYDCEVGGSGQEKMDRVVNCIFSNHPNVASYYATEILKEYLTPNPTNDQIRALAQVIKDNNFHLDVPMRTLLSSEVFYSEEYKNTVAKNSTEVALELVRTLNIPLDTDDLEDWVRKMGMPLTQAPTVFWFPESTWTSAPVKLEAINFLQEVVEDDYSGDGWVPQDVLPAGAATPAQVITHVATKLGVTLTNNQRSQLEFFMNNSRNSDGSFTNDPYDNESASHQRTRGLGVYQILGMSIDFQMK